MAKKKAKAKKVNENNEEILDQDLSEQIEGEDLESSDDSALDDSEANADEALTEAGAEDAKPTFAESKGSEANQHAKALAQKKAKGKAEISSDAFYSIKGDKLLKHIAKPGKVFTVYVGSMRKHGESLASFVKKVKAAGKYLKLEDVKPHMHKLQAELAAKAIAAKAAKKKA